MEEQLIDTGFNEIIDLRKQRWALVPLWMKVFSWIFMVLGPIAVIVGIIGVFSPPPNFTMAFYGLNSTVNTPILTVVISLIFLLKAIVGFGLWRGKIWALELAILDASIGMLISLFTMFITTDFDSYFIMRFNIRVELIFLIFYFLKAVKLKPTWILLDEKTS